MGEVKFSVSRKISAKSRLNYRYVSLMNGILRIVKVRKLLGMNPNDLTRESAKISRLTANYGDACNYSNYNVCGQILRRMSLMMLSFMVVTGMHIIHASLDTDWIREAEPEQTRHTLACTTNPAERSRASKRVQRSALQCGCRVG